MIDVLRSALAKRVKILVVGDQLLDEYRFGVVDRISPEAPVPVFTEAGMTLEVCGGALKTRRLLSEFWNCNACHVPGYPVIRQKKIRFMEGERQVFRCDTPVLSYPGPENVEAIGREARDGCDAVIVSDYRKGAFTEKEIHALRYEKTSCPIVIDSKRPAMWKGVGITKCNHHEATNGLARIVTRGADSPLVDGEPCGLKIEVPAVVSVIGAGDCFTAIFARMVAAGLNWMTAAQIAHQAGAAYVQRPLEGQFHPWHVERQIDPIVAKVQRVDTIVEVLKCLVDTKVVFTNGCFDVFHSGHVTVLQKAKKKGDMLIVGLNDDASVRVLKGRDRPINNLASRIKILAALDCVDFIVPFADTPLETIHALAGGREGSLQTIVKGPDWAGRENSIVGRQYFKEAIAVESQENQHSSDIIKRLM